jgi:replication factor A1
VRTYLCNVDLTVLDVIGIVTDMEETVGSITTKANKQLSKRNITIVDTSAKSIELTLWGNQAENPGFTAADHPVLAIKGAKVSEFKSKFQFDNS